MIFFFPVKICIYLFKGASDNVAFQPVLTKYIQYFYVTMALSLRGMKRNS